MKILPGKYTLPLLTVLLLAPLAALPAADVPNWKSLGWLQDLPLGFGKPECNTQTPRQGEKWELDFLAAGEFSQSLRSRRGARGLGADRPLRERR